MWTNRIPDHAIHGAGAHTIVLLHGAYGSKEYWRFTIERLCAAGYRVVAWDAPGYGISPVQTDITVADMAHALKRLTDSAASGPFAIMAHSMGGMVAQKYAALHPGAASAYVLSATAHTFNHSGPEWQANFMKTRVGPLTAGRSIPDYAPDLLRSMMGPGAGGPIVEHILSNIRLMRDASFAAAIRAIAQYHEDRNMAAIAVPVLCIAGELDETCPARVMKAMAGMAPKGEFHELQGVGHFGFAERPAEYHDTVIGFLKRAFASV